MTADEALVALVSALESLAIPHMVSGSLATNVYGVPRATDDGDFVVELPPGGKIATSSLHFRTRCDSIPRRVSRR